MRRKVIQLLFFLVVSDPYHFVYTFVIPNFVRKQLHHEKSRELVCIRHSLSSESSDEERKQDIGILLDTASKLRQEAEELELYMTEKRKKNLDLYSRSNQTQSMENRNPSYKALTDSYWMLSYRFSSEPIPDEADSLKSLRFYSGKVTIHLRSDGYTEFFHQDRNSSITFEKFWGWDEETSAKDRLTYLMFSADVLIPEVDPLSPNSSAVSSRYYFSVHRDINPQTGEIQLSDGVITLKREFLNPPGGIWGLFNAGGILAEFKRCGSFLCKPTSVV